MSLKVTLGKRFHPFIEYCVNVKVFCNIYMGERRVLSSISKGLISTAYDSFNVDYMTTIFCIMKFYRTLYFTKFFEQ